MDSDEWFIVGALALGGYAVYKVFNDKGVQDTTAGIGTAAQGAGNLIGSAGNLGADVIKGADSLIKGTQDIFSNPNNTGQTIGKIAAGTVGGQIALGTGIAQGIVQGSGLFNTPNTSGLNSPNLYLTPNGQYVNIQQATVPMSTTTTGLSAGAPPASSGLYSSGTITKVLDSSGAPVSSAAKSIVASQSTPLLKTTGGQSFGATGIKSVGSSGKYKTTL